MKKAILLALLALLASPAPAQARVEEGVASFYAQRFHGRTMADGGRFDARRNYAASRTLPLGSVARVTNKRTGRSAVVRIRDRGPYVGRRIIDVSPATARQLGFEREGLARVRVALVSAPPRQRR